MKQIDQNNYVLFIHLLNMHINILPLKTHLHCIIMYSMSWYTRQFVKYVSSIHIYISNAWYIVMLHPSHSISKFTRHITCALHLLVRHVQKLLMRKFFMLVSNHKASALVALWICLVRSWRYGTDGANYDESVGLWTWLCCYEVRSLFSSWSSFPADGAFWCNGLAFSYPSPIS